MKAERFTLSLYRAVACGLLSAAVVMGGVPSEAGAAGPRAVVEPFWRKTPGELTLVPEWYDAGRPVTRDVRYDDAQSPEWNGDRLEAALESLRAGDHLVVFGGEYVLTSRLSIHAVGTAERPIRVAAADGERVTLRQADAGRNAMEIDKARYLSIEGLTVTGGSQGVRIHDARNVMLAENVLHGFQDNAVTANTQNTERLYFVDNEIFDTSTHGEAFYLGAHDGKNVTHHTYVVGNFVHDLNGPAVTQGDGIEVKQGSYAVTVKWNFVRATRGPGIITYGTGRGPEDRNVVEENVVVDSKDNALQIGSETIVRNNLIVTRGTALLSKPETYSPRHLTVTNNTFVTDGRAVRTFGWDEPPGETITFANNAVCSTTGLFAPGGLGRARAAGNVNVADLSAAFVGLATDASSLNAAPRPASGLVGPAVTDHLAEVDLFGRPRGDAPVVGAVLPAGTDDTE